MHRLQQLGDVEIVLRSDRTALLARRQQEDRDIQAKRDQEDSLRSKQLEVRDREEDVSAAAM